MKLKLTLMAAAAVLALGYQAHASIGTVTNYSKLNVAITVVTNKPSVDNGNVTTYSTGKAKATTKDLLGLFAAWYDVENTNEVGTTTWPSGAFLAQAWDSGSFYGHVVVLDKTGTNVLYDATATDGNDTHYFSIDIFNEEGAYNEKTSDNDPGSEEYTWFNNGYYELYDDDFFLPYTDLYADGANTEHYVQHWDSDGNYTTWSDTEKLSGAQNADYYNDEIWFLDNDGGITATANISSSGHGKGSASYLY